MRFSASWNRECRPAQVIDPAVISRIITAVEAGKVPAGADVDWLRAWLCEVDQFIEIERGPNGLPQYRVGLAADGAVHVPTQPDACQGLHLAAKRNGALVDVTHLSPRGDRQREMVQRRLLNAAAAISRDAPRLGQRLKEGLKVCEDNGRIYARVRARARISAA